MKIDNKQIAIILVSVAAISMFFGYLVKADTYKNVSGYMVLMDYAASAEDTEQRNYSTIVFLPSDNCEAYAVSCGWEFAGAIDDKADLTKDGFIDMVDIKLVANAFGCTEKLPNGAPNPCWEEKSIVNECYFSYSGGYFKDSDEDCRINMTDVQKVVDFYGAQNVPYTDARDINKDGIIDIMDVSIIASKLPSPTAVVWATDYRSYSMKKKYADMNGDGMDDISDVAYVGAMFGQAAKNQGCKQTPLTSLGGGKWRLDVSGRGLYHVGATYKCQVPVTCQP